MMHFALLQEKRWKRYRCESTRSIIEDFMLDIMYEIPKDSDIGEVIITKTILKRPAADDSPARSGSSKVRAEIR